MSEDEKLVILREMTGERDVKVLSAYLRLAARTRFLRKYPNAMTACISKSRPIF